MSKTLVIGAVAVVVGAFTLVGLWWGLAVLDNYEIYSLKKIKQTSSLNNIERQDKECRRTSDCIVVSCDACDSGIAVNKAFHEEYEEERCATRDRTSGYTCVPPLPSFAHCVSGQCAMSYTPSPLFCIGGVCIGKRAY